MEKKAMKEKIVIFTAIGLFVFTSFVYAAARDDAKALVKRAVAYVKYQGKEKAIAEISKARGMFDMGELYVFAYDVQGVMLAHLKNPELIGKNLINVPDNEGKLFRKEILEKAMTKGSGWVDYVYLNPETKGIEYNTTYIQKVGDIIICCGAYKEYSHGGD
jgi:signal transduction histidine kinase